MTREQAIPILIASLVIVVTALGHYLASKIDEGTKKSQLEIQLLQAQIDAAKDHAIANTQRITNLENGGTSNKVKGILVDTGLLHADNVKGVSNGGTVSDDPPH